MRTYFKHSPKQNLIAKCIEHFYVIIIQLDQLFLFFIQEFICYTLCPSFKIIFLSTQVNTLYLINQLPNLHFTLLFLILSYFPLVNLCDSLLKMFCYLVSLCYLHFLPFGFFPYSSSSFISQIFIQYHKPL